jgi:chorismate-pyruvate lyase
MVALRRDHDPVRAGQLLGRYLAAHPNGALREEALVLAIEAAADGGDTARARDLARTYRAAYPRGRFQQFAADHAGSSGQ